MPTICKPREQAKIEMPTALSAVGRRRLFRKGESIFCQGDGEKMVFFVHSGLVKLTCSSGCGRDVITNLVFPGEEFGMMYVFDGQPYDVSATCVEDTEVTLISAEACAMLLRRSPELLMACLQNCVEKGRQQRKMMVGMAVESAEQRAARALLLLASKLGSPSLDGLQFRMPLSRQELSELMGTTVETAIRILSRFRKRDLIEERDGELTIKRNPEWEKVASAA